MVVPNSIKPSDVDDYIRVALEEAHEMYREGPRRVKDGHEPDEQAKHVIAWAKTNHTVK